MPEGIDDAATQALPQRGKRAEETLQRRRRRDDGDLDRGVRLKLTIPNEIQDRAKHEDKELRWINDDGNRMHSMTVQDDWDKVEGVEPVPVGTTRDGKPIMAYLCSKPGEFYREDQGKKSAYIKSMERNVEKGAKVSAEDKREDEVSYTPRGNRISRGDVAP